MRHWHHPDLPTRRLFGCCPGQADIPAGTGALPNLGSPLRFSTTNTERGLTPAGTERSLRTEGPRPAAPCQAPRLRRQHSRSPHFHLIARFHRLFFEGPRGVMPSPPEPAKPYAYQVAAFRPSVHERTPKKKSLLMETPERTGVVGRPNWWHKCQCAQPPLRPWRAPFGSGARLLNGPAGSKRGPACEDGAKVKDGGMPLSRNQGAFGSIRWRGFSVAGPAGSGCRFSPLRAQAVASGPCGLRL